MRPANHMTRGRNTQFQVHMVDALAIYIRNTYPKLVAFFHSLARIVQNIMLAGSFSIHDGSELKEIFGQIIEERLDIQDSSERWETCNPEKIAKSAAAEFRRFAEIFKHEAAGSLA